MSYSLDLRIKVLSYYESNESCSQNEAAKLFGISLSTFKRWLSKIKAGEDLNQNTEGRGRPSALDEPSMKLIQEIIGLNPCITLRELSEKLNEIKEIKVGKSVLSRALQTLNLRYKKLSVKAVEKESEQVK